MHELAGHEGAWTGSNAFRLMADDPTREGPITATLSRAAKGGLTQFAYAWAHPDDGDQEGLLVLGPGADPGTIAAFWGDSWHQQPVPMALDGTHEDAAVTVGYVYAGEWGWEIVLDAAVPDELTLTMRNVVSESAATDRKPAGPYEVMRAVLRRAG